MLEQFTKFKDQLYNDNNNIKILNNFFKETIFGFNFLFHTKENPYNTSIQKIPNPLKMIILDRFSELDSDGQITNKYYILCFSNILIIIDQKDFPLYQDFFVKEKESTIFCIKDDLKEEIEQLFSEKDISLKFSQQDDLINEISSFNENCHILSMKDGKFQSIIQIFTNNILAFLIRKSYALSVNRLNGSDDFFKATVSVNNEVKDYVFLRQIATTFSSSIQLQMNINNGQLFVFKIFKQQEEEAKLSNREKSNFLDISHPFLLRCFGTINIEKNHESLILEFINGKTLNKINFSEFKEKDKLNFIFSIMIIIQYFHFNNFIYRDLKPSNLMIDNNNSIVLIDLDRMIKGSGENITTDFAFNKYIAPEIRKNNFVTEKVDIYSLGWLINYIINKDQNDFKGFPSKYHDLLNLCKQCVEKNPEDRPTISKVISTFITKIYFDSIEKNANNETEKNLFNILENNLRFSKDINDSDALFTIGFIYSKGICVEQNFEKAIEKFTLASDQNNADATYYLGKIFNENPMYKDEQTAHELFQKSADLGNQYAQYYMGLYYYKAGNFQEAIRYLTLSANQDNPDAQFSLGQIYYEGKDVLQDIVKAIDYYKLSAKKGNLQALYNLGVIYFEGKHVKRNSKEAVDYLTLAADQNNIDAQYYLSFIYYEGENFIHNEEKAIYYATLAANKNKLEAQKLLGKIYLNKTNVFEILTDKETKFKFKPNYLQNIDFNCLYKAIHYFAMAARKNDFNSIFALHGIYTHTFIDKRSEKKREYYDSLLDMTYTKFSFNRILIEYDGPIYGQNIEEVINYLSDLSNQDDINAKYALGMIYLDDVYVDIDIEKAIQYLSEAANKGCLKAISYLSFLYMKGSNVKQDVEKGIGYLFQAANLNDIQSQVDLLKVYSNGQYIEPNMKKVNEVLDLIESQKNINSLLKFANICYEGKLIERDINRAIRFLEIAEKQNCLSATIQLGIFYLEGKHVKQDFTKSFRYFSFASNRNNPYGQFYLGLMYFEGFGVKQNYYKSFQYFLKSAKQKNGYALTYIALFALEGKYIPKDVNRAMRFLNLSYLESAFPISLYIYGSLLLDGKYTIRDIHNGLTALYNIKNDICEQTFLKLGIIFFEGELYNRCVNSSIHYFGQFLTKPLKSNHILYTHSYFKDKYPCYDVMKSIVNNTNKYSHDNITFKFFLDKASKNDPIAQFVIGSFYYQGIVVGRNIQKAIKFYYYSAIQGYKDSMLALGVIFSDGKFIDINIEKAITFLLPDNELFVHPDSIFILGSLYYEGKYIKQDIEKAINLFSNASSFNNSFAKNNLGVIFRQGIQRNKNISRAVEYFDEAIKYNKNDYVASYNLAHIFFFENNALYLDKFFKLLIHSANKKLLCAFELLCLVVYKIYGCSKDGLENFKKRLIEYDFDSYESLAKDVSSYINREISSLEIYDNLYEKIKNIQLMYIYYGGYIFPKIENDKLKKVLPSDIHYSNIEKKAINQEFYDGFDC